MRPRDYVLLIAIGIILMSLGIVYRQGKIEQMVSTTRVVNQEPAKELKEIANILASATQKTTVDVNYHSDQRFDELSEQIRQLAEAKPQVVVRTRYITREIKPEKKRAKRHEQKRQVREAKVENPKEEPKPIVQSVPQPPRPAAKSIIDYDQRAGKVYAK